MELNQANRIGHAGRGSEQVDQLRCKGASPVQIMRIQLCQRDLIQMLPAMKVMQLSSIHGCALIGLDRVAHHHEFVVQKLDSHAELQLGFGHLETLPID